jgi:hypothetical protein
MNEKLLPEFSSLGKFISISLVFFSMSCCGDFALDAPHSSDPSLMYVVFKSTILVLTKFQTQKVTEKQCQEVVYITNKAQVEYITNKAHNPIDNRK